MISTSLFSGAFLGWSLGANDAANIFGTAVTTKIIKYRTAMRLTAFFVILGAFVGGYKGLNKLSTFAYEGGINTAAIAFIVMLAAAFTVTLMTILKLPVSTSQAVIGAIMGGGILYGKTDFSKTFSFFSAWIITPIGALIIAFIIYKFVEKYIEDKIKSLNAYNTLIKYGYYIAGIFAAFSLGANNVANVTSIYTGKIGILTNEQAVIIGGVSIALGVLTFSKRVINTVGKGLTKLTRISGFIAVLSAAIIVYFYSLIGIPVSTSQAIVGAVIGIGLVKGVNNLNFKILRNILFAWIGTPTIAFIICFAFIFIYKNL